MNYSTHRENRNEIPLEALPPLPGAGFRLTQVTYPDDQTDTFTYDHENRLVKSHTGGVSSVYTYDGEEKIEEPQKWTLM